MTADLLSVYFIKATLNTDRNITLFLYFNRLKEAYFNP